MKPKIKYNLSKIFRNAWYMFRVKMVKNFAEALRKAWKNEKLANIRAMIEGRPLPASEPTPYNIPTGSNPAFAAGCVACYGDAGRYYGDWRKARKTLFYSELFIGKYFFAV